jgi:hypothetical protein
MFRTVCFAAALALLSVLPSYANAQWPNFGGCGPWSGANGYYYNMYYQYDRGYVPLPPYFSVYPPVYYSPHITARPYGASPYAWPAGYFPAYYKPRVPFTIPAAPAVPASADVVMINNPYVANAAKVAKDESAPKVIENPYFVSR